MRLTEDLAAKLQRVIGAAHFAGSEEQLREYAVDGVVPKAIVRPKCEAEIVEIVQFAASEGLRVIASGSRSKMGLGMPPGSFDIAVDMRGMSGISHFDAGDLTLSAEAGMPLRSLEAVLRGKNQFLPIAVPCYETTTVGGAVATGIDSTLREQYGTVRDFLIGAEFVDGKGTLCKSGGRVVKNVTGYDLHKLLIGSLGTLGIITRLNFRTFPSPPAFGGFSAAFADAAGALAFRWSVRARGLPVANMELRDAQAAELARDRLPQAQDEFSGERRPGGWSAYVRYEGNEAVVRRITRELESLAHEKKALDAAALGAPADAAMGGVARETFDWLRRCAPAVALFRITLPALSAGFLTGLNDLAAAASLRTALLVRAGGVIYLAVLAEQENPASIDSLGKVAESVFAVVAAAAGCATLLHAPLTLKQRINVWGPKRADFAMMERIKNAFDPARIFAPDRFVGGL